MMYYEYKKKIALFKCFQPFDAYFPKISPFRQGQNLYLIIDTFDKNQI